MTSLSELEATARAGCQGTWPQMIQPEAAPRYLQVVIPAAQAGGRAEGAGAARGERGGRGGHRQLPARLKPLLRTRRAAPERLSVQAALKAVQVPPLRGQQGRCSSARTHHDADVHFTVKV